MTLSTQMKESDFILLVSLSTQEDPRVGRRNTLKCVRLTTPTLRIKVSLLAPLYTWAINTNGKCYIIKRGCKSALMSMINNNPGIVGANLLKMQYVKPKQPQEVNL